MYALVAFGEGLLFLVDIGEALLLPADVLLAAGWWMGYLFSWRSHSSLQLPILVLREYLWGGL